MRVLHLLVAAALLGTASPASAQLADRSVGLEVGFAGLSGLGLDGHVPVALTAAHWLGGGLSATARLAMAFPAQREDRRAAYYIHGSAGLRWDFSMERLRPFLFGELGWYQLFLSTSLGSTSALAPGCGGGLEWFLERGLSASLAATTRRLFAWSGAGGAGGELALRVSAYF